MSIKLLLLILITLVACNRGKYYVSGTFREGIPAKIQSVTLDSSYVLYLRQSFKKDGPEVNAESKSAGDNSTITRAPKKRVEVQYLLVSLLHKMAIYFSTIPDKYQQYYSRFQFADTLINAYDFSTFYFGRIQNDGESIVFETTDSKKIMTWDIRPFVNRNLPAKLFIREIAIENRQVMENIIHISKALHEPIFFEHQGNFNIIFYKPERHSPTMPDSAELAFLAERRIYFRLHDHGSDIYFRFDKAIGDSKDSAIIFDHRRTRYSKVLVSPK